jgi:hypothetical protein
MSSDHLYLFTALAAFNKAIQEKLQAVRTHEEIVAIASERGYRITVDQLSLLAHRLNGDHWVWARRDAHWRARFFAGALAAERTA